jgi:tripartite-type tricarboxylate transporter receptor subunit TctC
MGGQVDFAMASTAAQAQHVRGGKMRALVLTGEKRSHTMPDVPTLKESGIDVVAHAWWGILAPAGTPRPIIDKFHSELRKALELADVKKMLTETLGMDVVALRPEATRQWIVEQMARWSKVVKENNIRPD